MSHFAQVINDVVIRVIVAEQNVIDSGIFGSGFIQTSYNTTHGVHTLGGIPLRKNYAAVGYTYDSVRNAFIPPKPFSSWILNEDTCQWEAPIPHPTDAEMYRWNETNQSWELVT